MENQSGSERQRKTLTRLKLLFSINESRTHYQTMPGKGAIWTILYEPSKLDDFERAIGPVIWDEIEALPFCDAMKFMGQYDRCFLLGRAAEKEPSVE